MKKLFSLVSVFVLALALVGCDLAPNTDNVEEELATLQQEKDELEDLYALALEDIDFLEQQIASLEQQIEDLQELLFDNVITITLTDDNDVSVSHNIGFNDDFDGTLLDLLDLYLDVEYTTSEWGRFIDSMEDLTPKAGAFISIGKNGEASMVGIDDLTFTDEDEFTFTLVWWDMLLQQVDQAIDLFVENLVTDYVSTSSIDYNVLVALSLLDITEDYITKEEVETVVQTMNLVTVQDYFKAITLLNAVGSDVTSLLEDFVEVVEVGPYGQTAYALLSINSVENAVDFDEFISAASDDLLANSPYDLGLDAGAITLVALSAYPETETMQALVTEFVNWVSESQLPSGGVQTRDIIWGETTYPGTENAATLAQVILGLVATDNNPSLITNGENSLVSRLLEFQNTDGSFNYIIGDETADVAFSTPQAFLALVVFDYYINNYQAINPYHFE